MRDGIASSISASRDDAPTAFSIAAVSSASGPMWRDEKGSKSNSMRGLLHEVLILRRVEQRAGLARIGQLHHDHPARVRVGVHRLRLVLERRVHFDHLTGDRRI